MIKYIAKRLLIFIPTLLAISLLTFVISINAPGDPVEAMLNKNSGGEGNQTSRQGGEIAYVNLRHELGFDLPVFYFSITDATEPDTLYKVYKAQHRKFLSRLSYEYGNWYEVSEYFRIVRKFDLDLSKITKTTENAADLRKSKEFVKALLDNYDINKLNTCVSHLENIFRNNKSFVTVNGSLYATKSALDRLVSNKQTINRFIPSFHWYGFNNQYHNWISNFCVGNFGISYQDRRPVNSIIADAIKWTMLISIISIIIAYFIAIPLGVKSAVNKGKNSEKAVTTGLFVLYSLPNFWVATMLITFLCGGDYLDWFPAFGIGDLPDDEPFIDRFLETAYHFVLPVFCATYGSLAFISRQMRGGMLNVIGQDYIRTARAKGLPENKVIWKHALKNSLIPIITLFASIFPLAISGSFAIEFIFSIPGLGKISLEALTARNFPIVFTVMMFTAILTLIGNLVADVLYAVVDPRISFNKKG